MPINKVTKSGKRYQYKIYLGLNESGDPDYHYMKSRKKEGLKEFKDRIDGIEARLVGITSRMTFDELFKLWYQSWKGTVGAAHSENMLSIYENHIKKPLGGRLVHFITPRQVSDLLQKKSYAGKSKSLISKIKICISMPYEYGIVQLDSPELLNPTDAVSIRGLGGRTKERRRVLNNSESERFLEAAQHSKYENYFKLLLATGFRPSEALGLKVKDISNNGITLVRAVTEKGLTGLKNEPSYRAFPMTDAIRETINNQLERNGSYYPEAWIFPAANGSPSMAAVNQSMSSVIKNINKEIPNDQKIVISPYDFRHTFATRAARVLPPKTLQYLMGHADIATTLKYYVGIEDEDISHAKDVLNMVNF